jgi:ABC-type lipoprotein export system ATPase subunit
MIKLQNISKYYRTSNSVGLGLRKINLEFDKGEFVVVTGQSGSGKSTLLNVISGLDGYEEGEMYLFGEETSHFSVDDWEKYRALNIGYISQNYNIVNSYTVLQNVLVALETQDYPKEERKSRAMELIEMVGLTNRIHHKAGKLSGGEKQRTVIARALAKDAPVIVCDEPTGNLDSQSSKTIISLIEKLGKDKLIILVTHNYEEVKHIATRRIRLRDGEVIEDKRIVKQEPETQTDVIDFENQILNRNVPFLTLLNSSIRTLFATPKRLFFMLTLQTVITGIFIFIYAYLMHSSDLLIGELASDNDSSHRIELVKRDESKITDLSEFEDNDLIKSLVEYEMIFHAYQAIGLVDEESTTGTYAFGEINMNDAAVLTSKDLTNGRLPNGNEVVLSDLSMELYDLEIGDKVSLLRVYTKYTESIGDVYIISGTTLRGNNQSVYFNSSIFTDKDLALYGLLNLAGKSVKFDFYYSDPFNPSPPTLSDILSTGKFVFDETLDDWEIEIPDNLFERRQVMTDVDILIGSYYGDQYIFDEILMENVRRINDPSNNVYLSTTYKDALIEYYFNDNYVPSKIVLNVHDLADGKKLANMIDQETYRLYYDVAALDTREAIMTQDQFSLVSYIVVLIVGTLLYTIFGVVLKNVYKARKKDFTIFRSIGANRSFLAKQMILEQIISSVFAFAFIVALILILSKYSYGIAEPMENVKLPQYLILFIVTIGLSIQVSLKANRQIFNISIVSSLNESEEAK